MDLKLSLVAGKQKARPPPLCVLLGVRERPESSSAETLSGRGPVVLYKVHGGFTRGSGGET